MKYFLRKFLANGACFLLIGLGLLGGCAFRSGHDSSGTVATFKPGNIYKPCPFLPIHIRRVAVLPISPEKENWQAAAAWEDLQPVLFSELGKTKAFEQVPVTRAQLLGLSGQETWQPYEKLPANLFKKLEEITGCDAVLFTRLQPYHAFQPIVIGWEFKLVDVRTAQVIWAADEVFDAGEQPVARAALHYYRDHHHPSASDSEPDIVLISPRRFGEFTLSALLGTLPSH